MAESMDPVPADSRRNHHGTSGHQAYADLHRTEEFRDVRSRYRSFAIPWTVAFLVWYLLYVVMSNWATGFMNTRLFGNINVALVFGLLQFASTFLIAWLYAKHMNRHVDPVARRLEQRYNEEIGR